MYGIKDNLFRTRLEKQTKQLTKAQWMISTDFLCFSNIFWFISFNNHQKKIKPLVLHYRPYGPAQEFLENIHGLWEVLQALPMCAKDGHLNFTWAEPRSAKQNGMKRHRERGHVCTILRSSPLSSTNMTNCGHHSHCFVSSQFYTKFTLGKPILNIRQYSKLYI